MRREQKVPAVPPAPAPKAPVKPFDRNDPFPSIDAVAEQVALQLEEKRRGRGRPAVAEP